MAVVRSRENQNQFRKVYPGIRKKPDYMVPGGQGTGTSVEAGSLTFTGQTSQEYTYTENYSVNPAVTATAVDSSSNGQADINVWVAGVSTSSVTIGTSTAFTGKVNLLIVEASS